MSGIMTETPFDLTEAVRNLVTEDDEPVDNIFLEKQQRLLVDSLYESWTPPPEEEEEDQARTALAEPRPFWAAANVGIFHSIHAPGIAPDFFLSLDVAVPANLLEQRSYFMWEYGKAPDVVIEVVSNREGNELGGKLKDYARIGATYYVVFDPFGKLRVELGGDELRVYEIGFGKRYRRRNDYGMPEVGLSLTLWEGHFEDSDSRWLRWLDARGDLVLTGHERASREASARRQAEDLATQAEDRAARLAARLRELGVEPE